MNNSPKSSRLLALPLLCIMAGAGCESDAPPEPKSRTAKAEPATGTEEQPLGERRNPAGKKSRATESDRTATGATSTRSTVAAKPVADVPVAEGDPVKGQFTLEDATKGLPKSGTLVADLKTDKGTLKCELWPDKAPITVANFVGLARGLRPWKDPKSGEWVKKPLYDGTPFHRIIRGFMVQGGDPKGNGSGGPGYVIPDEIWEGARHDERGLLCMANRGPNTNGSQFFILDGAAAHLDGGYTIFGKCGPDQVIEAIAGAETRGDRAVDPPKIEKVTVRRET